MAVSIIFSVLPRLLSGELRDPIQASLVLLMGLPYLLARPLSQILAFLNDRNMLFVRGDDVILFNRVYGRIGLRDITQVEPTRFFGEELIQISGAGKALRIAISEIEPNEEAALTRVRRAVLPATENSSVS